MTLGKPTLLVFTNLDGTLLDDAYDHEDTNQTISQLQSMNIAIIFCSSKTQGEIEFYRERMSIDSPFIAENGGSIVIPKNYFPFVPPPSRSNNQYDIFDLGVPYPIVREKLSKIKLDTGAGIIGFGDLTVDEIAAETGLSVELAKLAKNREYDEPCRLLWGNEKEVAAAVEKEGLSFLRGSRYFHLWGGTNKGKAASLLKDLCFKAFGKMVSFGIGDSPVDLPMLGVVDVPLLVRKAAGGKNAHIVAWRNLLTLVAEKSQIEEEPISLRGQ
uniref:Mannosyl-3-phosphoglycerate phosphatase n=1 Tax=uncultured crenarchaeote MCG TaxID=529375 RepID=B2YI64_9CREN|nr:mannosyl-3-phosphoglycerate phosphatase [uncultured crenarchaeote MCG]